VNATKSEQLMAKIAPLHPEGTTAEAFKETLYGGDARAGRWIYLSNSTAQCVRCHGTGEETGTVGPNLSAIGSKLTREQLLQALVEPSYRLAPGYGTVTLTLADGQSVSGVLMEENKSELILKTSDAEPLRVPLSRITKRENAASGMPPMGTLLSRREIRDIIEFLAGQKESDQASEGGHGE
jgi:putative heme-binding domain-containing protein